MLHIQCTYTTSSMKLHEYTGYTTDTSFNLNYASTSLPHFLWREWKYFDIHSERCFLSDLRSCPFIDYCRCPPLCLSQHAVSWHSATKYNQITFFVYSWRLLLNSQFTVGLCCGCYSASVGLIPPRDNSPIKARLCKAPVSIWILFCACPWFGLLCLVVRYWFLDLVCCLSMPCTI